eukprot:3245758-Rhodomonas_salina.6
MELGTAPVVVHLEPRVLSPSASQKHSSQSKGGHANFHRGPTFPARFCILTKPCPPGLHQAFRNTHLKALEARSIFVDQPTAYLCQTPAAAVHFSRCRACVRQGSSRCIRVSIKVRIRVPVVQRHHLAEIKRDDVVLAMPDPLVEPHQHRVGVSRTFDVRLVLVPQLPHIHRSLLDLSLRLDLSGTRVCVEQDLQLRNARPSNRFERASENDELSSMPGLTPLSNTARNKTAHTEINDSGHRKQ